MHATFPRPSLLLWAGHPANPASRTAVALPSTRAARQHQVRPHEGDATGGDREVTGQTWTDALPPAPRLDKVKVCVITEDRSHLLRGQIQHTVELNKRPDLLAAREVGRKEERRREHRTGEEGRGEQRRGEQRSQLTCIISTPLSENENQLPMTVLSGPTMNSKVDFLKK